jgi:hypothetical protein
MSSLSAAIRSNKYKNLNESEIKAPKILPEINLNSEKASQRLSNFVT